jgi:hypothetical protein
MNYRILLSLTVGMSLLQLTSSVQAASYSTISNAPAVGSLEGSSSGSGVDMTLNKARWSIPSCEKLKSAEPPPVAQEEEFDTPASLEAKAKKEAALKKVSKKIIHAPVAPSEDQANQVDTTASTGDAQPEKSEAPMVRLTLTPAAKQEHLQTPTKIAVKRAITSPASTKTGAPASAIGPMLIDSQSSSVSSRPDSTAPTPGNGAPLPGGSPGTSPANIRPSKTAAKSNTQANADYSLKELNPRA